MTEYVSQGDGFLMNDNDPTRPMVMYYHNLIMQYAEQGDVQSVRHNLRLVKGSPGALARALHRAALGDGRVLKVLLEAAGTAAKRSRRRSPESCSRASLWTRCHTSSLLRFTRGATK